eukprot:TRINITY_DN5246_c0_g1_i9.p1 TRINITY_DN5246_c0_g1~~TRINITY_DN5246_c0_g1_i9.p1  ORF type:complete len:133 (-),score=23.75 TRINITY_DN5246_c0_g1_i9:200-598(-)
MSTPTPSSKKAVQTFGKKVSSQVSRKKSHHFTQKTAIAVAYVTEGKGMIRVNGQPLKLVQPEILQFKLWEPVLLLGKEAFSAIDIRVRVKGGGYTAQVYAIRQCIAKAILAWTQKCTFLFISFRVLTFHRCG